MNFSKQFFNHAFTIVSFVAICCLLPMFLCTGCTDSGKKELAELTAEEKEKMILIDNRTAEEYAAGHLQGAVLIPYTEIRERIAEVTTDKDAPIYLYCRSGRRSGIAKETLESMGFKKVTNLGSKEDAAEFLHFPIVTSGK